MAFSGNIGGRKGILDGGPEPHENAVESVVFEDSEAQKENSAGRIRTYTESIETRAKTNILSCAQPKAQPNSVPDPDLHLLMTLWPSLPSAIKVALLAIARSVGT